MKIPFATPGNPASAFAESPLILGDNEAIPSEIVFTKAEILELVRDGVIGLTESTGASV